jgi:hypothetical protein
MASDICPRCGKPAHGFDFDCPELTTNPGAAPAVATPTPPAVARATGSFHATEGSPITRLQAGTLVGEYQIVDRIAEGGMGTVYSAVHPIIGKKVAIKVLSGRLAKNSNAIRRFVLEARAVNDIRHPALVDIFSFGRLTDGRPYYVMEFLDGRSLGAVLRTHQRLTPFDTYPVFMDVGRVLVSVRPRHHSPRSQTRQRHPRPSGGRPATQGEVGGLWPGQAAAGGGESDVEWTAHGDRRERRNATLHVARTMPRRQC